MSTTTTTKTEAETYLQSLLNKTLRITTTDKRMFLGHFKCTDSDQNIILAQTHEYTLPTPPSKSELDTLRQQDHLSDEDASGSRTGTIKLDMTSRFVGLVVVPGEFISRIEVEEFASQLKK